MIGRLQIKRENEEIGTFSPMRLIETVVYQDRAIKRPRRVVAQTRPVSLQWTPWWQLWGRPSTRARERHVLSCTLLATTSCVSLSLSLPAAAATPPDPAGLFSEGGEVIQLHIDGSLTIPTTGIKWVYR